MKRSAMLAGVVLAMSATGCYHATIDTGLPAGNDTIEKQWAHGFVYGLVPPSEVETASECPNGVARVETQLSFLNQVASALTFGLYTPMTIEVTCAAEGAVGMSEANTFETSAAEPELATVEAAIRNSVDTGSASYLRFVPAE